MKGQHRKAAGLAALLILLISAGCDSAADNGGDSAAAGILVANQGNFSDANGSVTVYDPEKGQARPAIADAGSIVQSLYLDAERLYVVANSGGRIDVFDVEEFQQTGQITGLPSPRYMHVNGTKAYVSNLFADTENFTGGVVSVVDLSAGSVVGEIAVGENPEGLAAAGHRLYVANHTFGAGSTLSVIDMRSDMLVDTVDVECDGPRWLITDPDHEVFVFCTGQVLFDENFNVIGETDGAIRVLHGATGEIVSRIDLDGQISTPGPGQEAFLSSDGREIFTVMEGARILVVDTGENRIVDEIGPLGGDPIGAIAFDAAAEALYLGRVPSFIESGSVTIHDRSGTQIGSFNAGVAPSFISVIQPLP